MTVLTTPMPVPMDVEINIGTHPVGHLFGMTFNLDTIWVTVVAGAIVVLLGFWARRALTEQTADRVPTKLQLVWEGLLSTVTSEVEGNLGKVNPFVVPLAVALFFFILIANWIEVLPTQLNAKTHLLPSPTADTNLTYAMAALVIVGVWTFGVHERGLGGYLGHFVAGKMAANPAIDIPARIFFTLLNILEELIKPVTLALRLFGNIFAGGIMLALIGALVSLAPAHIPVGSIATIVLNVVWKLFDTMFLGGVQAFIFALLTVLYFGMAGAHGAGHDDQDDQHDAQDDADRSHDKRHPQRGTQSADHAQDESPTPEPAMA